MLFCPQTELRVDCHVDADFAGSISVENKQDQVCAKSQTEYVIIYGGAALLWESIMQMQITLSPMEAECVALS